jgi:hypothetical protein
MFKGFHGHFVGADIDRLNLHWVAEHLLWVSPVLTQPRAPLPSQMPRLMPLRVFLSSLI